MPSLFNNKDARGYSVIKIIITISYYNTQLATLTHTYTHYILFTIAIVIAYEIIVIALARLPKVILANV